MLHLMVLPLILKKHLLNKKNPKKFKILKSISAGDNPKLNKVKKFR
jgi:hypothetical protein